MTLTEYLNQADPVRMPHVELEPNEYRIVASVNSACRTIQAVEVPALGMDYVKYEDENVLRVPDEDGNPRARSCFYLSPSK